MMKGYKTYTGLVIALLGYLGVSQYFGAENSAQFADNIVQLAGLILAAYGRYKAGN